MKTPDLKDMCKICLRTDLKVNMVDSRLINFHDELCNYSYSLASIEPTYCMECEHLLRKLYNFKEKCILAVTILHNWNKQNLEEKPVDQLYTLLPQSTVGIWMPSNIKIYDYKKDVPEAMADLSTACLVPGSNILMTGSILSINVPWPVLEVNNILLQGYNTLTSESDTTNSKSVLNTNVKPTIISNIKLMPESNILRPRSNIPRSGSNIPRSGSMLSTNVRMPITGSSIKLRTGSNSNIKVSKLGLVSNKYNLKLGPEISVSVIRSQPELPVTQMIVAENSQRSDEELQDTKVEKDCNNCDEVLNLDNILETEEIADIYDNILQKSVNNFENAEESETNVKLQCEDDYEMIEYLDETILKSDNDIERDNAEVGASIRSDDIREIDKLVYDSSERSDNNDRDTSISSNDICEIDIDLDKTSADSDDDNGDEFKENASSSVRIKKFLADLTNISLFDCDFITESMMMSDDESAPDNVTNKEIDKDDELYTENVESNTENEELNTANKIIADLQSINTDLDSLNENYEKIILQSGNIIEKKNNISVYSTRRFEKKLEIISEEMDIIQEYCRNILNPQINKKSKEGVITIMKLVKRLRDIFISCGELKSPDDVPMDKEHIQNCLLDGKVSEYVMTNLFSAIQHKDYLTKRALQTLSWIQNIPNKNQYEYVFDVEFINTTEQMMQEFQLRRTYEYYTMSNYKCELCYLVFQCATRLEKHMKRHREGPRNVICSICRVRFTKRKDLHNHMRGHEIVYKCKLCPLVTYNKGSMVQHYNQHIGVTYRCEPCDKTFRSHSAYKTHCGSQHLRPYVCTTCGRSFDTEDILNKHKRGHRTHIGNRRYKCDICNKGFLDGGMLNAHVRGVHLRRARKIGVNETGVGEVDEARACGIDNAGLGGVDEAGVGVVDELGLGRVEEAGVGVVDELGLGRVDEAGVSVVDEAGAGGLDKAEAGPPTTASLTPPAPAIDDPNHDVDEVVVGGVNEAGAGWVDETGLGWVDETEAGRDDHARVRRVDETGTGWVDETEAVRDDDARVRRVDETGTGWFDEIGTGWVDGAGARAVDEAGAGRVTEAGVSAEAAGTSAVTKAKRRKVE